MTPTALYGACVLALRKEQLERFAATQRKMLRNIVGWVRVLDEPWEETMRRMKRRVEAALRQHPVCDWTERLHGQRWDTAWRIGQMSQEQWPKRAARWNPPDVPDQLA